MLKLKTILPFALLVMLPIFSKGVVSQTIQNYGCSHLLESTKVKAVEKQSRVKQKLSRLRFQHVKYTGFSLLYDNRHEQSQWVSYLLTRERAESNMASRKGHNFVEDSNILLGSALWSDYKGAESEYGKISRGHLAPAADMKWSKIAMRESFLMSNVSPQYQSFNDGLWVRVEKQVRQWALDYDTILVFTGPVLKSGLPTIGESRVSVPQEFYKVVMRYSRKECEVIAFLVPNMASNKMPKDFACSVKDVEEKTGLDFFSILPQKIQKQIESQCDTSKWKWKNSIK